jgi:hypothetical protein
MNNKRPSTYYIENLTAHSWVLAIFPYFLGGGLRILRRVKKIYYFDASKSGLFLAKLTLWFIGTCLEQIKDSSQVDLRDHDGRLVWMRTAEDALSIQDDILSNPEVQRVAKHYGATARIQLFLSRHILSCELSDRGMPALLKLLFFLRIIVHKEDTDNNAKGWEGDVFLFMKERPWLDEFKRFAQGNKVNAVSTGATHFYVEAFFLRFNGLKSFAKKILYCWMAVKYQIQRIGFLRRTEFNENKTAGSEKPGLRLAVEYYGHLNLGAPETVSDLFFFQQSNFSARDILIYFGLPGIPATDTEWSEIKNRGISAVAINSRATVTPRVPVFNHRKRDVKVDWPDDKTENNKTNVFVRKWLRQYMSDYRQQCDYWVDFITRHNIKIHVTWYKNNSHHCAILDALKTTGGLGVVYQRSFEHCPTPWTFTTADVVFGFSRLGAHIGWDRYSSIPYYVAVGYLGDHRFGLLRKQADQVRASLQRHGAKKIVAYFDEQAINEPRWNLAYESTLEQYSYLLNKVLENPWFGLILKPKVPLTLRSRLQPISDILRKAEETGRCFVYGGAGKHSSYSPAAASLSADVAIHGHFFAATAGVEAALAGTPTFILDYEGVPQSLLYDLGTEDIIFRDIDSLWRACVEHWNSPGGIPRFGDWSGILDEIDPFRDGRAAERMGTYLGWLMEGFKAGLPRETVLADAAQRYSDAWGEDKVLSINFSSIEKDLRQSCLR